MLNNKKYEKQIIDNGFVVIPFLTSDEVNELKVFYKNNPPEFKESFHSTPLSSNIDYKRTVNEIIKKTFERSIREHFTNEFDYFFGSFTVKEPSPNSEWDIHQDWTFVDENKFASVGVWIPLIDVTKKNGCLSVVKKSHLFIKNTRGTNTVSEYEEVAPYIKEKYLTEIPMKAGNAIIFMNNLLHYSPPNFTNEQRISVNCLMFPMEATPIHYFRENTWDINRVEKFEISAETMINHNFRNMGRPSNSISLGEKNIDVRKLDAAGFKKLYKKYNPRLLKNLFQKIINAR